jgi:hypothetical protein
MGLVTIVAPGGAGSLLAREFLARLGDRPLIGDN